jgi:hypothetical protein
MGMRKTVWGGGTGNDNLSLTALISSRDNGTELGLKFRETQGARGKNLQTPSTVKMDGGLFSGNCRVSYAKLQGQRGTGRHWPSDWNSTSPIRSTLHQIGTR